MCFGEKSLRGYQRGQLKRWLATDYYGDDGTIVTMYESMVNDFARQVTNFHREFHVFRPSKSLNVV